MIGRFLTRQPRGLEQADIASALDVVLWTLMVSVLLLLVGPFVLPAFTVRWLSIIAAMYALCVPALVLNRRGHMRLANYVLVVGLWALITVMTVTAGGIAAVAPNFYLVLILVAGLLLGARGGVVTAMVCMLTLLAVLMAEMTGRLAWTVVPYTPFARWIGITLLIGIMAGLQYLAAMTIGNALRLTRESGERYRTLAETASDAIVTIDPNSRILYANTAIKRLFGYDSAELIGKPLTILMPERLRPLHLAALQRYVGTRKRQTAWESVEFPGLHRNGHEFALEVSFGEFTIGGEHRFTGILRDVSERKRAEAALRRNEELFRAIVGDQTEMIVRWKPDGTRTFVNRSYCDVFGGTPEDFIGTSFLPLVVEKYQEGIREKTRSLTPDRPTATEVHESLAPNGSVRWQEWTDRGIFDAEGRLVELQSTGRDITERVRAEEALRASTDQLRALSARLQSTREEEGQRIAREIHDELGGALTGLRWDLEGITRRLPGVANDDDLQWIRERIALMNDLIASTVGTVRRISADLRPAVLDDLGLIAAVEWQVQQFQARTGIACGCDTAPDAADLDRERATAVFRICQEILTNVLRHAHATHVQVRIRKEPGSFVLEVTDDGRGITVEQARGAGSLGLLGMRERARLVGGDVEISGAEGTGTHVVVRVPIAA